MQRWESGPYFAAFSLHIPDMRSFLYQREIVKIWPRSPIVSIKPVPRIRTPKSDRLPVCALILGVRNVGREKSRLTPAVPHRTVSHPIGQT